MFFGLDIEKLLLIGVVAVMIVGPQRLPQLAQSFARFVVRARSWTNEAKVRVKEEMGDELDDIEWRKLDPRQYDPRRIIRQALLEAPPERGPATPLTPAVQPGATTGVTSSPPIVTDPIAGGPTPRNQADTPPASAAGD